MRTRRAGGEHVEKMNQTSKRDASTASKETMKQPKGSALPVGVELIPGNQSPPPSVATEDQPRKQLESPTLHYNKRGKKSVGDTQSTTRRSQRLQNAVMPVQDNRVDHLLNEVTISATEDEVEDADDGQEKLLQSPSSPETLEEKVDFLTQRLEAQETLLKELKSLNSLPTGTSSRGSFRYKKMYFRSQRKSEALMDVNQNLTAQLEFARGKIEGYETAADTFSSAMEKLRDVITASTTSAAHLFDNARDALVSGDSGAEARKGAAKRKREKTNKT